MIRKQGDHNYEGDRKLIRKEVIKELTQIGLDAESYMLDYLEKHNIDYQGDLAKSIRSEVEEVLNTIRMQFGSGAKHGIFVHDGTKPHWAPEKPIRRWVIKKLNVKGKNEISSATWFVRKKIAERGTEAKPYAGVTMRLIRRQAPKRIDEAIQRGIKRAS